MEIKESYLYRILNKLIQEHIVSTNDSVLIVFGGEFDRAVFDIIKFQNFQCTNIDQSQLEEGNLDIQDGRNLQYKDNSFDVVVAHAGIHHADRPHQAVCEMYRVAKKVVLFVEAQDSFLMKMAVRFKLVHDYEMNAIRDHQYQRGGVNDLPIPNYVYRWTRREIEKLIRTLDPVREPCIQYYSEWDFTWHRVKRRLSKLHLDVIPESLLSPVFYNGVKLVNWIAGSQGNLFAVCIRKDTAQLFSWIEEEEGVLKFRDPIHAK